MSCPALCAMPPKTEAPTAENARLLTVSAMMAHEDAAGEREREHLEVGEEQRGCQDLGEHEVEPGLGAQPFERQENDRVPQAELDAGNGHGERDEQLEIAAHERGGGEDAVERRPAPGCHVLGARACPSRCGLRVSRYVESDFHGCHYTGSGTL